MYKKKELVLFCGIGKESFIMSNCRLTEQLIWT